MSSGQLPLAVPEARRKRSAAAFVPLPAASGTGRWSSTAAGFLAAVEVGELRTAGSVGQATQPGTAVGLPKQLVGLLGNTAVKLSVTLPPLL